MAPVDSRELCINLLFRFGTRLMCETQCGLSTLPANTRRWTNAGPMLAHCLRRWPSIKPALVQRLMFAGLCSIAAGLVVLTTGGDYKLTQTQCLLDAGPASTVLAKIHSALVSTSCWRERVHIQRGALLQTAVWKYLLISQVCITIYRLLERLWQAILQTAKWKYLLISQVCLYRILEGLWQAKESAVTPEKRKYIVQDRGQTLKQHCVNTSRLLDS